MQVAGRRGLSPWRASWLRCVFLCGEGFGQKVEVRECQRSLRVAPDVIMGLQSGNLRSSKREDVVCELAQKFSSFSSWRSRVVTTLLLFFSLFFFPPYPPGVSYFQRLLSRVFLTSFLKSPGGGIFLAAIENVVETGYHCLFACSFL